MGQNLIMKQGDIKLNEMYDEQWMMLELRQWLYYKRVKFTQVAKFKEKTIL